MGSRTELDRMKRILPPPRPPHVRKRLADEAHGAHDAQLERVEPGVVFSSSNTPLGGPPAFATRTSTPPK